MPGAGSSATILSDPIRKRSPKIPFGGAPKTFFMERRMLEAYLKDLEEVVNIDCGSATVDGVTKVAEIMKRHYDELGFATELVDLGPKAGKGLRATNKPSADHYDIMFNAHLDTVFPEGTVAERPFKIEGDRVTGPGCADCKAGVIAILHALKTARKEDLDRLAILVCYNPDEEVSSISSRGWLVEQAKTAKYAIVCEPGRANGGFVRSRKGRTVWDIAVHGVSAHAGNAPQDGRSAVLAAAHLTIALSALQDLDGRGTSVTVGVVHGGTVCNTVPDLCTLKIDTRFKSDEDGEYLKKSIRELAQKNWGDGITVEAKIASDSPAMPFTDRTKALVDIVNEAARRAGYDATWVDAGGGSDVNKIAAYTIVVDGVAPAGSGFHSAKENLQIPTIENRVATLKNVLELL